MLVIGLRSGALALYPSLSTIFDAPRIVQPLEAGAAGDTGTRADML
jgi:hypothetical protein